ncbi:MAG TPA: hypothetical protein VLT15_10320 [Acidimicrobiia bacterium]|nr:hypothetical protein [Acidimicrobiia bacterium]
MPLFDDTSDRVTPVDHVTGAGASGRGPEPKQRGRVLIGMLGGLAIGLLLAAGSQLNSPDAETSPSTIPPVGAPPTVPTTTTTLAPSRLDILVDGYEGTLFLAGAANQQGKLWRWESRTGAPLNLEVPNLMTDAGFNASGVRVAVTSRSGSSPWRTLWIGTAGNQEPIAVDVATWRWHAHDPSRIAWVEVNRIDGSPELHVAVLPVGVVQITPLEELGTIVRFDDSGLLLDLNPILFVGENPPRDDDAGGPAGYVLAAVDLDGREFGRNSGRYVGTLPDGRILISQAGNLMVTASDLTDPEPFGFPSGKRMASIEAAPDGSTWAIWEIEETTGVSAPAQLWILRDDEMLFETTLPSALRAVSWSQDGRWLIAAVGEPAPLSGFSSGQLWFVDTEDWSMHAVEAPGFVFDIAAVP